MLQVQREFINKKQEIDLLSNLRPSRIASGIARNKIIRYGSALPYGYKERPIPDWLTELCMKVTEEWQKLPNYCGEVNHVTINEYHKGQSIDWHIDSKTSGEVITVLSLESDVILGLKDEKGQEVQIPLPARSLLHMTEEDRWKKQHCIYPVKSHRWSLVFRYGNK